MVSTPNTDLKLSLYSEHTCLVFNDFVIVDFPQTLHNLSKAVLCVISTCVCTINIVFFAASYLAGKNSHVTLYGPGSEMVVWLWAKPDQVLIKTSWVQY